jgi:tetratricopeptide (TPR) repeat protein
VVRHDRQHANTDWRRGDADWLRLDQELDNFRAAFQELAESDAASFVNLIWNLRFFCHSRGHLREGAAWSEQAVQLAEHLPTWSQARAWHCAGSLALFNRDLDRADVCFRRALEARDGSGPDDSAEERAWLVRALSLVAGLSRRDDEADALSQQAMETFVALGNPQGMLIVSFDQAMGALLRGDYARARPLFEQPVVQARLHPSDHSPSILVGLGILELREQRYAEAEPLFVEILEWSMGRGFRMHLALALRGLAATAVAGGRVEPAVRMLGAADRIDEETGGLAGLHDLGAFAEILAPLRELAEQPELATEVAAGWAMTDADAAAYARSTARHELVSPSAAEPVAER